MTCPVCGAPTVPAARFCFACGAALPTVPGPDNEAERRVVTVLFGDLSDFTSWSEDLDPERVGVVTDRVLATLSAAVTEFGGHVDKLTGDGLMAVFGAPTAYEDDPERAVRAAARMQQAVRRVVEQESGGGRALGLRVGLNTGEVLAGIQAHLSYTVIGDAVNTAARLSDAAGVGAVFAGRETALATMGMASWRALAPLRLKGKREPVPAYELVSLRPGSASRVGLGDEAPLIGREPELGLLVQRLLDIGDAGPARALVVTGDAGVGKTRLARELGRFAGELPQARVLWGRCAPYGEGRDLAAVVEMVRTACGIADGEDAATARARVQRTVARFEHAAYAGLLPRAMGERLQELLGIDPDQAVGPREAATPGTPTGGDQVREAVAALFTALAQEGPLLLVLDDLHWATPEMLQGMVVIATGVRGPALLMALGRPDVLELKAAGAGEQGWWTALPAVELLPLLPLEEQATERLLRAFLGAPTDDLDPEVRIALVTRAQGNPFFLAELLHLLVDRGTLVRSADRWTLTGPLPEGVLPAGVQAVLAARIDGLSGAAKGVLRDASVLGAPLSAAGLAAVGRASGHGDPAVVQAAVATLLDRRLLEAVEDGALRFGHTLVRDVAYAGLAKADRARRHAAAATFLQAAAARDAGALTAAAGQGERALRLALEMGLAPTDPAWQARVVAFPALLQLAGSALVRDDNALAEGLFRRALALADASYGPPLPAAQTVPARIGHAQALAGLHRLEEAAGELEPVLLDPQVRDGSVRASALVVLGDIRRKRGRTDPARSAFVQALAAAGEAGDDRICGEALRRLGLLDFFDGRLRDAERRFHEAYALAERVGDTRGAGWALQHLAWSATTRGDYGTADVALEQAAEVFTDLEDTGGLSWVAGTEGYVRLLEGRLTEARELAQSLLPLGEATGERWGVAALLTIDALASAELGEVELAQESARRAGERFAELGDAWGQALALVAAGVAARGADDPDGAVALLDEAVAMAEQGSFPLIGSLALVVAGYCQLARGDLGRAEAAAYRAAAMLSGFDLAPHAGLGADVLMAQVLRARGDLAGALERVDAALALVEGTALLFPRRQALAHRAGILLELGRVTEAVAAARVAVDQPAEDVRAHVLALRALGNALRADGCTEPAREALEQALQVARSTGQRSEVAASRRALAALAAASS